MRLSKPYRVAAGFLLCAALTACGSSDQRPPKTLPSAQSAGLTRDLTARSGNVIAINALDGSCDDGPHVALSETSSVVDVMVTTHPNGATSCDAMGHPRPLTIQLHAPLGARALTGYRPAPSASGSRSPGSSGETPGTCIGRRAERPEHLPHHLGGVGRISARGPFSQRDPAQRRRLSACPARGTGTRRSGHRFARTSSLPSACSEPGSPRPRRPACAGVRRGR